MKRRESSGSGIGEDTSDLLRHLHGGPIRVPVREPLAYGPEADPAATVDFKIVDLPHPSVLAPVWIEGKAWSEAVVFGMTVRWPAKRYAVRGSEEVWG